MLRHEEYSTGPQCPEHYEPCPGNVQCQQVCDSPDTTLPGAQEYAFDASNRIFERQQEAIEQEIIRAREMGQRDERERAEAERIARRLILVTQEHEFEQYRKISELQERNEWQAGQLDLLAKRLLEMQQDRERYEEHVRTTVREFLRSEYPVFAAVNGL